MGYLASKIKQRYVLAIMGLLATINAYTMRVSLNIAITEMVTPINITEHPDPDACPDPAVHSNGTITNKNYLYDWDQPTQGLILSSFYWGYLITHLPGGILAEKFGGKYTLGLGILSTAFFTLITPLVIHWSNGKAAVLIALRFFEGLGEGTTYPALNTLLAHWVPLSERATIGSIVYTGSIAGTVISNLVSGALIHATGDWASVFYLFGGLGVLWFILFTITCYSTPDDHPFISDEEKAYLHAELEHSISKEKIPVPWKAIFTSVPLWALICAEVGHDWGFYTMVTDLPTYLKDVLKFNIKQNGVWSSVPYIVMWVTSMFSGWICDWTIRKGMGITFSRKLSTTVASVGPAIFIVVASYSGCNSMLAVLMFTLCMGFMGPFYCGMKVNGLDLSPNFAGTLMAIVNGIGAITGMLAPTLAGALTVDHTLVQWRSVFWVSFGVLIATNIVYVIFASGEEQWWNNPEAHRKRRSTVELGERKPEAEKEPMFNNTTQNLPEVY